VSKIEARLEEVMEWKKREKKRNKRRGGPVVEEKVRKV